jgi:preprotein translocase subunit SecG
MSLALHYISWVLFFLSSVLLTAVILLQEGKGGGLAEAFGGVGAETFGVKSGGINKVTMTLAAVFCISALVINATWNQ